MRCFLLSLLLLGPACGSGQTVTPSDAGPPTQDASPSEAAADGSSATDAPAIGDGGDCNALVDDAPVTHFSCPGGQSCAQCTPPAQGGGTIQDGTYVLLGGDAYFSACGILVSEDTRAKLVVQGGRIDFVYSGPINFDTSPAGFATYRETYSFAVAGSQITIQRTCPPPMGPSAPADFVASGDILAIPVGPWASPPYYKRMP